MVAQLRHHPQRLQNPNNLKLLDHDTVLRTLRAGLVDAVGGEGSGASGGAGGGAADAIPEDMRCPITRCLMADPVVTPDGHSYERAALDLLHGMIEAAQPNLATCSDTTHTQQNTSTQPRWVCLSGRGAIFRRRGCASRKRDVASVS